jgi:hypothetical protein
MVIAVLMLGVAACNRSQGATELQTQAPQQSLDQPTSVSGCLRAGLADDAFVLLSRKAEGPARTVTYQLLTSPGVKLRSFVDQEVAVTGTVESDQAVATSGKVQEQPAIGAAGTPFVETPSELDVRKLKVSAVKPSGNRCLE